MSTSTLPNIRVSSDLTVRLKLKDGGVAVDWTTLTNIRASIFSDAQRAKAGRCDVSVDETDHTVLVCEYSANKPQYLGVNRVIVSCTYEEETKTYDKPAFNFVRWTDDQAGQQITIDDPDVDVEIEVEDISSSILQEAVDDAFAAADRANDAAAAAEHMVDIHQGPPGEDGKSPYIGENGHWYEWDEDAGEYVDTETEAQGETGTTPDITIGTVTTAEPGTPAAATMTGTPEAPVLNLTIPKGVAGDTPAFTVGEVTTGEPGTPVVVTITGTAAAPVLNIQIPQGLQGNTGSSVEYPYELVNNLTTNDATKGLSAAQGKVLKDELTQLEAKMSDIFITNNGSYSESYSTNTGYSFANKGSIFKLYKGVEYTFAVTCPAGTTVLYGRLYEQGNTTHLKDMVLSANDTSKSVSYTAPRDIVAYFAFGGPESRSISITVTSSQNIIPVRINNLDSSVISIEDKIYSPIGQFYQNAWVRYSDGATSSSSAGAKLYIIRPSDVPAGAKKIIAKVSTEQNTFAAIAFYSGDTPSTSTYLKSASVDGGNETTGAIYEAEFPVSWGCCIILNMSQYIANPSIKCDSVPFATRAELENAIYGKVGEYYQNAWVRYSDGLTSSSSGGAKLYIIKPSDLPSDATKIIANVSTEQSIFAAIAFYSGDTPSTATYMQSASVQGGNETTGAIYEATIPVSWGCCIVLNMSQLFATPSIRCNAIATTPPSDVEKIAKQEANNAKALVNLFAFAPFYHHLNQEFGASRQSIPAQSLLDITYAKRLGFTLIESNPHKCSDNVFVCKHGNGGKLGDGLSFASGSGLSADTLFSNVSSTDLRQYVKYDCNRPNYDVYIPTLDEFSAKCKQDGIAIKIGNDTSALAVVRKYLPDDMIFMTATARPSGFRGIIEYVWNPTSETIAQAIGKCDLIGPPLQITIASGRIDSMSDADIKAATEAAHLAGYGIGVVYTGTTKNISLLGLGVDSFCSTYRQINAFNSGDTFNITRLDDEKIELGVGCSYDADTNTITVPSGNHIDVPVTPQFDFGKVCVTIRYKGNITINCGTNASEYNLQAESDGDKDITFATAISPDSSAKYSYCFWLSANENTTIYDLKIHFSQM